VIRRPRRRRSPLCRILLTTIVSVVVAETEAAGAEEWGTLQGQVVVTGDLPEVPPLLRKSDPPTDAAICGAMDMPDDSLVIDPKGRGLANAFVYLKDPPKSVHPDRREVPRENPVFLAENCRLFPHALVMRAGQKLRWKTAEERFLHIPHPTTIENPLLASLSPGQTYELDYRRAERIPMPIRCDTHPWMKGVFLVVDHPYAAVTDANGRFSIPDLPAGELTFRVWHERPGYLLREWKVKIPAGKTTEVEAIDVPSDRLRDPALPASAGR